MPHRQIVPDEEPPPSWFSPRIEAGHVIQAAIVCVGVVVWAVSSKNSVDTAQRDIADLRTSTATEFEKLRSANDAMKRELLTAINSNPVTDRHFSDIERWISAQEAYRSAHETRISEIERNDARMRAELDAILRASNAPIRTPR